MGFLVSLEMALTIAGGLQDRAQRLAWVVVVICLRAWQQFSIEQGVDAEKSYRRCVS